MSTESVLAAIDGALSDWEVSGDAMRWTPEPPPAKVRPTGLRLTDGAVYWAPGAAHTDAMAAAWRYLAHSYGDTLSQLAEPMRQFGQAITQASATLVPALEEISKALDPEPGPPPRDDVRAHALWQARHRSTGPTRPTAGQSKRPRRP